MLARLTVTQSDQIRLVGFDVWVQRLLEGIVMSHAVEQAREDYARCIAELAATGHSEGYPLWMRSGAIEEILETARIRHKAHPEVTTEAYLHQCHKDLRVYLDSVTLLYLDTCHWIRLREVVMSDPQLRPEYVLLLDKLRKLRAAGKLVCPFSYPVYHELMKQRDTTRRVMAALIDELSGGICIQPPNQLERVELKRQILRSVLGPTAPDLNEWVWTKAAWVCGEMIPTSKAYSGDDLTYIQKIGIDIFWNKPLLETVEFRAHGEHPDIHEMADAYNLDAKNYRNRKLSYREVLIEEKGNQIRQLFTRNLEKLAKEVWEQFPEECAACAGRSQSIFKPDASILASVQIRSAVHASYFVSTPNKEFKATDLWDAQHAAVAIPYCDILFVERPLAHILTTKPLQFDKAYSTRVTSDPAVLLNWLKSL